MTDTAIQDLQDGCLQFLVALGLVCFAPVVVRDLWNWFAVPVFAVPALTYWTAFGLGLLKSILTYRYNKEKAGWDHLGAATSVYLFCWGVGALIR